MNADASYLVVDRSGDCVHATCAALELLRMSGPALRRLKVTDLAPSSDVAFRSDLPRTGTGSSSWKATRSELIRGDGTTVEVSVAMLRAESGELVIRLDANGVDVARRPNVHEVLAAWRREESELAASAPGTPERLVADAEIDSLRAQYRRLVAAVGNDGHMP